VGQLGEAILEEKVLDVGNRPQEAVGGRRRRGGLSDHQVKTAFLMPTLLLLIAWNIFPLLWSLYLSFCSFSATDSQPARWIGIANYHAILNDPGIWKYFSTTATIVVFSVLAQAAIGFSLAMLLNRPFPLQGFVTTLLLVPMMLSPVVVGLFWKYLFDDVNGLMNFLAETVFRQERVQWLSTPRMALTSLVIVDTWMWSPFMMLISLAGLSAVPPHLYEAAEVDRASSWFKFRWITLPMVAPLLLVALLFRTMDAFKLFDLVYVMTKGAPGDSTETLSLHLYRIAFDQFDTGKACALAYIMLVIIIALSNLYVRYLNKVKEGH
jgi:multiple sugar transport system permease protein